MAGLELVVRPVVFPNIRPAPPRSLPAVSSPDKGFAVIHGMGAKSMSVSNSFSSSTSTNRKKETQRRVDEARVYQKTDDGTVDKYNYVDIEVANKVWMKGAPANFRGFTGDDLVPTYPGRGWTGDDIEVRTYERVKEKDNIEIKKRDVMRKKEGTA